MSGYTKLSSSLVTSTVWRESAPTRCVWITMLALADQYGEVEASVPGLADAARVTLDECVEALRVLSSPDPWSRTKDFEGRRIAEIEGGWELLNHKKYRHLYSDEERRKHTAERTRRWRAKQSGDAGGDASVTLGDACDGKQKQKQKQKQEKDTTSADAERLFDQLWAEYPRRPNNSKADARKAFLARLKEGVLPEHLSGGVRAYKAYCDAMAGRPDWNPHFVKQAATFFGPGRHWESDYTIPAARPTPQDADVAALVAQATDFGRMSA